MPGKKNARSKHGIGRQSVNPVKYANELAQHLTLEEAHRVLTECKNGCDKTIAQGDYLLTTPSETKRLQGFYGTAAGYLKNKLERKGVNKG